MQANPENVQQYPKFLYLNELIVAVINAIKTTSRARCIYSSVIKMYSSTSYVGIGQVKMAASTYIRMGAALRKPHKVGPNLLQTKNLAYALKKFLRSSATQHKSSETQT